MNYDYLPFLKRVGNHINQCAGNNLHISFYPETFAACLYRYIIRLLPSQNSAPFSYHLLIVSLIARKIIL